MGQENSKPSKNDTIGTATFDERVGILNNSETSKDIKELTTLLEKGTINLAPKCMTVNIFPPDMDMSIIKLSDSENSDDNATSSAMPTNNVNYSTTSDMIQNPMSQTFFPNVVNPTSTVSNNNPPPRTELNKNPTPINENPFMSHNNKYDVDSVSSSPFINTELINKIKNEYQQKQSGGGKNKHKGIHIRSDDEVEEDDEDGDELIIDSDFEDEDDDNDDDIAEDIPHHKPQHKPAHKSKPVHKPKPKSKESPFMKKSESEHSESSPLEGKRNLKKNYLDYTSSASSMNKYSVSPVHTSDIQMYSEN